MSAFSRAHSRFSVKFSIPDCFNSKINKYCNDLEVAHPQSGSSSTWFLVELEFGNVGFWGEGKTGVPGEKPLGATERTNNKLWTRATLVVGGGALSPLRHPLLPAKGQTTTQNWKGLYQAVCVTRFDQSECVICRVIFALGKRGFQRYMWWNFRLIPSLC